MSRVTLLTDFGTTDGYVGAMKGVLATGCPGVILDDVAHDVPMGDVAAASRSLGRYWRLYPPGTVHLAVVDPGVGTSRRPIAIDADGRYVVAPDNGLVSGVLAAADSWRAVEITERGVIRPDPSTTFHGRDVFAPAAAHLAAGSSLDALGPVADGLRTLEEPAPMRGPGGAIRGRVVGTDGFGNLASDIPGDWVDEGATVEVAGARMTLARTYGDVPSGRLVAVVNSDGFVEIAVRDGSAAERLRVGTGATVRIPG